MSGDGSRDSSLGPLSVFGKLSDQWDMEEDEEVVRTRVRGMPVQDRVSYRTAVVMCSR
jgi:hypothetical protein